MEWETTVYFWTFFGRLIILWDTISYSALGQRDRALKLLTVNSEHFWKPVEMPSHDATLGWTKNMRIGRPVVKSLNVAVWAISLISLHNLALFLCQWQVTRIRSSFRQNQVRPSTCGYVGRWGCTGRASGLQLGGVPGLRCWALLYFPQQGTLVFPTD